MPYPFWFGGNLHRGDGKPSPYKDNMALHPNFPESPYVILDPDLRWFPAPTGEALRGASMDGLMRPLTGNAHSGGATSSISRNGPT